MSSPDIEPFQCYDHTSRRQGEIKPRYRPYDIAVIRADQLPFDPVILLRGKNKKGIPIFVSETQKIPIIVYPLKPDARSGTKPYTAYALRIESTPQPHNERILIRRGKNNYYIGAGTSVQIAE